MAALEFAFVLPALILILGGIFETGLFILTQSEIQSRTIEAARQIRLNNVGPTTSTGTTNQKSLADFKSLICTNLYIADCLTSIRVDVRRAVPANATVQARFADLVLPDQAAVGPPAAGGNYTETYNPGAPGDVGALTVTYDWKFTFPGMTAFFGNVSSYPGIRRLAGFSVYRNEL